ncbi:O-antigen ligase family protein [Methylobacterium radiotolerans]|uniref:O-antigen ligase family protein n=1 Tax=Methylobacterium TaxID=407 RepID=UPI001FD9C065|nr:MULTISPECIES: O-antigen ligase family protein [Methylobacterium]
MAFPRDLASLGPGHASGLAWSPLGPYGPDHRWAGAGGAGEGVDAMPRLGVAAAAWIVLFLFAPVVGEQIKLPGVDKAVWIGTDLIAFAFLVLRRDLVATLFGSRLLLLSWPLLAIASALWSLTPGLSAYHGLQLLATIVAGITLRTTMGLSRLVRIVFLGLLAGQLLSAFLTVAAPALTRGTDGNWAGIYSHKNVLGSLSSLQILCAACLFLQGWNRLLTAFGFCLALALLLATHSATALVAATAGLMPLAAIFAWRQGKHVTGFCLGIAIALAGVGIFIAAARGADISASLLSDLGKDTTLTGRTVLWQFGLDQFWREPLIGIGYKAYWESPVTTAAYLHFVMKQKLWFFHNNFIDTAVAFGIVGVILFTVALLDTARRVIADFARSSGYVEAWPILFMSQLFVLVCFECPLFVNHGLHQLLLAAILPVVRSPTIDGSEPITRD